MNTKIFGSIVAITLAASTTVLAVDPVDGDEESVQLEPLVIFGRPDPLDLPLVRLRALLDASAPCLGCDARAVATEETKIMGLIRFLLLPAVPPPRDEARQIMTTVRCSQAGPEMEYFCR